MIIIQALALTLLCGHGRTQMTCPSGYVAQYGPTAAGGTAVRCCNNLAPGGLTCTTTYTVDKPGDYLVYCTDLFPTPDNRTCHCGRDCSGTVMPDKTCNGTCLCTTIYCCSIPGIPCNHSSPLSNWKYPPSPLDNVGSTYTGPTLAPRPPTPPPTTQVYARLPTSGATNDSLHLTLFVVFLFWAVTLV
jgi:hypothetical protein